MSNTDATKGQAALASSDYPTSVSHLTKALNSQSTPSPLWLIQRSTAYQRTGQHALALADADNAVLAAHARGKRELIATAHFRRAVALHGMGRYGDARLCLLWCQKFNEKEKGVTMWQAKVKADYEKAGGEEAECNKVSVKEVPDKKAKVGVAKAEPEKAAAPAATSQTPKEKIRNEWYQSNTTVTIEIFAKGVPHDAEVDIQEGSLEVSFPIAAFNTTYDYTISPLFSKIDKSKSSFRITPHKVEIVLTKSMPGLKWSSLEGTALIESTIVPEPAPKIPAEVLKAPAYPTSSRKGPTNWDKVVEGDDKDEGEEIDGFFKKLYKDADPDTKRAMMKSYQESNGTALSTSWSDVGSKKVETVPPEGLEAKKWEI
ncbi:SGS-domain-containing protein [Hyaloscypha bicolor E]|uniref:SGS-domain-containing protein n=1 Tax=Hyaloscypha bicolor E TaxID=1095630 RepID=A0A2J6TBY0_9HELO|nr:SGS-domain-containing protein [Hyaloscypha bicolor E]PMD60478.1 SGS-domain-containing protein [Hyaloscypha bicolor E]